MGSVKDNSKLLDQVRTCIDQQHTFKLKPPHDRPLKFLTYGCAGNGKKAQKRVAQHANATIERDIQHHISQGLEHQSQYLDDIAILVSASEEVVAQYWPAHEPMPIKIPKESSSTNGSDQSAINNEGRELRQACDRIKAMLTEEDAHALFALVKRWIHRVRRNPDISTIAGNFAHIKQVIMRNVSEKTSMQQAIEEVEIVERDQHDDAENITQKKSVHELITENFQILFNEKEQDEVKISAATTWLSHYLSTEDLKHTLIESVAQLKQRKHGNINAQEFNERLANFKDLRQCLRRKAEQLYKPDFVVVLGDNFYDDGTPSPTDPIFKSHFYEVYDKPELTHLRDLNFFNILGNHGYNWHGWAKYKPGISGYQKAENQLLHTYLNSDKSDFSQDVIDLFSRETEIALNELPKWTMPSRYYSVDFGDTEIFFLDSNTYARDYYLSLVGDAPHASELLSGDTSERSYDADEDHSDEIIIDGTIEVGIASGSDSDDGAGALSEDDEERLDEEAETSMGFADVESTRYRPDGVPYSQPNQAQWFQERYKAAKALGKKIIIAQHHGVITPGKRTYKGGDWKLYLKPDEYEFLREKGIETNGCYNKILHQIFKKQGIDAFSEQGEISVDVQLIAAHDHNISYCVIDDLGISQVISGGGGGELQKRRNFEDADKMPVFMRKNGFAIVDLGQNNACKQQPITSTLYPVKSEAGDFRRCSYQHLQAKAVRRNSCELTEQLLQAILTGCHKYIDFFAKKQAETKGKYFNDRLNFKHSDEGIDRVNRLMEYLQYIQADSFETTLIVCYRLLSGSGSSQESLFTCVEDAVQHDFDGLSLQAMRERIYVKNIFKSKADNNNVSDICKKSLWDRLDSIKVLSGDFEKQISEKVVAHAQSATLLSQNDKEKQRFKAAIDLALAEINLLVGKGSESTFNVKLKHIKPFTTDNRIHAQWVLRGILKDKFFAFMGCFNSDEGFYPFLSATRVLDIKEKQFYEKFMAQITGIYKALAMAENSSQRVFADITAIKKQLDSCMQDIRQWFALYPDIYSQVVPDVIRKKYEFQRESMKKHFIEKINKLEPAGEYPFLWSWTETLNKLDITNPVFPDIFVETLRELMNELWVLGSPAPTKQATKSKVIACFDDLQRVMDEKYSKGEIDFMTKFQVPEIQYPKARTPAMFAGHRRVKVSQEAGSPNNGEPTTPLHSARGRQSRQSILSQHRSPVRTPGLPA